MLTPPSAGVVYEATGTGVGGGFTSSTAATWSHISSGGSKSAAVVGIIVYGEASSLPTCTVKYGSSSMTQIATLTVFAYSTVQVALWLFGLTNIPSGTQTITPTIGNFGSSFSTVASSTSYQGVSSIGTSNTALGSTASTSVSLSSAIGNMAVGVFANISGSMTPSPSGGTSRYNSDFGSLSLLLMDNPGASTETFSVTIPAYNWGWIIANLVH